MMTRVKERSDAIDIDILGDGDGPRGCSWDEEVCTNCPTHFIKGSGDEVPQLFCARHYALSLAYYLEVHCHEYCSSTAQHFEKFGRM